MIFQLRRVSIVSRLSYQLCRAKREQRRLKKNNGTIVEPEPCPARGMLVHQQLMSEVSALSHLGDLRRGARRRIIRHLVAADGDVAQQLEWS